MPSSPQPQTPLELAEKLKIEGKFVQALELLEQLLSEDPGNVIALEEIADNELSLQHYERAETAAAQVLKLVPDSETAHFVLGFLRSHEEQWEPAVHHLREANRLRPNHPEILRCLGWALFQGGKRPQGVVTLERALNLDRDNVLILCDLGVVSMQVQNMRKARALLLRALELDPQNARAQECLIMLKNLASAKPPLRGRAPKRRTITSP
jgi:tetratricopeptide (TPR) repeat protein